MTTRRVLVGYDTRVIASGNEGSSDGFSFNWIEIAMPWSRQPAGGSVVQRTEISGQNA